MGLFSRKKKKEEEQKQEGEIPTLPELPELPTMAPQLQPIGEPRISEKPTTQEIGTITPTIPELPGIETKIPKPITTPPKPLPLPPITSPMTREINSETSSEIAPLFKPVPKKIEPLFIKLDKFEGAMNTLEDTKQKISEIESLLTNIKEIKSREEQELTNWQKEIQEIKIKINTLDKELFGKL